MKFILSIALIVAIVGFINAQSPPTSLQSCTTYVNSTAAAFCAPYVSYAIRNATDYGVVNTAAKTEFDSNIAKITNATDACRTALATYSCHNKISRCARNAIYTSVFQDTCNAVVSACGLNSTFPGTTFTGVACVANKLVTVEGNTAVCIPTQNVAVGASCRSPFTPDITTPTTVAYSSCPIVSSCNTTSTNPLCVVPSQVGDACSVASDCVNNPLSSGTNGVGSTFVCISNKCTYTNKRYQQSCFSNDECLSKNCTSGQCYEAPFGGYCTTSGGCRLNLYCDTKNSSCTQVALLNEPCGFVQANQDLLPCASGFTCVRGANGTASICRANANEGSACVPASGSIVQDGPLCNPISANGLITCQNNVCRAQSLGQTLGQGCNTTVSCSPQYTCSYTSTDINAQGTCVNPGDVSCANVGGSACNTFQRCNCGADATQPGTCAVDTTNPRVNCAAQQIKLAICQANTCNNAPFIAYEANACVTTQCKTELNSYYCCVKNTVGASFVAPNGMPSDPCATPSPTPGPTSPTSTGTGTPVPIQSSKRSSASAVAVNFIAVILAVVAFL